METSGRDNYTGYGFIDAEAALLLVKNNNVQRSRVKVASVQSSVNTGERRLLDGYQAYIPATCGNVQNVWGSRWEFTARVNFTKAFTVTPQAWVRWADSDGIDTRYKSVGGNTRATYDPFDKALEVISLDKNGFTVKGSYWFAEFYDNTGRKCPTTNYIPTNAANFNVAYTAIGIETTSLPLTASISGPSSRAPGQSGTWTASTSGGKTPYAYRWDYQLRCPGTPLTDPPVEQVETCDKWHFGGNAASFTKSTTGNWTLQLKLTVTDSSSPVQTKIAFKDVTIGTGSGGVPASVQAAAGQPALHGSSFAQALPGTYALEAAYPNPFNAQTRLRFALPEASLVRLVVYDVTGREVARLVEGVRAAGYHEVGWEASGVPGGVYLYRLEAGAFTETRRMVLVK